MRIGPHASIIPIPAITRTSETAWQTPGPTRPCPGSATADPDPALSPGGVRLRRGQGGRVGIESGRPPYEGMPIMDMKLEAVVVPVSDIDQAKKFYTTLGWREDADFAPSDDFRIVQLTPPGSACSIQFGTGLTRATPGSVTSLYLVVEDIVAARAELVGRGVSVSEVWHEHGPVTAARFDPDAPIGRIPGPDPGRGTYSSFASFDDPDGNGWLLQEITTRLPGRD
jgi:catechol 2,3-dioxygenase-like lactoylglutathione lyase family enzyme